MSTPYSVQASPLLLRTTFGWISGEDAVLRFDTEYGVDVQTKVDHLLRTGQVQS